MEIERKRHTERKKESKDKSCEDCKNFVIYLEIPDEIGDGVRIQLELISRPVQPGNDLNVLP